MIHNSFQVTIRKYISSSVVLIVATMVALLVANSPWSDKYKEILDMPVSFSVGDFNFFSHDGHALTLSQFICDFLMAIFFLSVGLDIKRELLVGELSSVRKALLPVIGACGGMLMPVIVFYICCPDNPQELRGMAIPMATDIAFSLGVLSLFSKRVPASLKVFLAALAVADDLGGIIVIALFYSTSLDGTCLACAACVVLAMLAGNVRHVRSKSFYILMGMALWFLLLNGGIHATIAGVITAFCIPCRLTRGATYYVREIREKARMFPDDKINRQDGKKHIILSEQEVHLLRSIEMASDHLISPLQDMVDSLRRPIHYIVVPIFAFASAGVILEDVSVGDMFTGVGFAVMMGLVVGKVLGIFTFSWIAIRTGLAKMPSGATWHAMLSVCMLGGIGFTVSMFIADLSYHPLGQDGLVFLNDAKLGILCGSFISGLIACLLLRHFLPKKQK